MPRRRLDSYYTPDKLVADLLARYPHLKTAKTCEPCAGHRAISKHLDHCLEYDIDPELGFEVRDAKVSPYPQVDAFVTNPPFNEAYDILLNLLNQRFVAEVYLLLRLSFLEPTLMRGEFLARNPPAELLVTPRVSFTGDGHTDSVTTAWMVWRPGISGTIRVQEKR